MAAENTLPSTAAPASSSRGTSGLLFRLDAGSIVAAQRLVDTKAKEYHDRQ